MNQCSRRVPVRPQGLVGTLADGLLYPLMWWLQGCSTERPQRTHYWNSQKFAPASLGWLDAGAMVTARRDAAAQPRGWLPLFHMPRFGTWQKYLVVCPRLHEEEWFVGWRSPELAGLSRIPLCGPVKLLRGNQTAAIFGVDQSGMQIALDCIGCGCLGDGRWPQVPLR